MNTTLEIVQPSVDALLERAPVSPAQALRTALKIAMEMRSARESGAGACAPSRPAYTAPEVLAGSSRDARSDIFEVGAIAYHLLTGRAPFPGNSAAEILEAARNSSPAPIGPAADAIPGLEALVCQCLDPNPNRRRQSLRLVCIELKLLCAAAERVPAHGTRRFEIQMRERIADLESSMESRMTQAEQALAGLREVVRETWEFVRTAVDVADERDRDRAAEIESLQASAKGTEGVHEQLHAAVRSCNEVVAGAVQRIDSKLEAQAESIESLHTISGRTDDLLERVVESIASLQSFVLERTGEFQPE